MFFTVETLLEKFDDFKLIAGEAGTHEIIKSIYVADAPEMSNWGKAQDLILTSGYVFKDDPSRLQSLIEKLSENGVAALAIKVGFCLGSLPAGVIETADKLGFPLIDIPAGRRWDSIMPVVIRGVMEEELDQKTRSRIVSDLVIGGKVTPGFLDDAKRRLGCTFESGLVVAVARLADDSISNSISTSERSARIVEASFLEAQEYMKLCYERFSHGVLYDKLVLLLELDAEISAVPEELRLLLGRMRKFVYEHCRQRLLVGVSAVKPGLASAHDAYEEAQQTLSLAAAVDSDDGVIAWDDLGVYAVLAPAVGTRAAVWFIEQHLGPIIRYDSDNATDLLNVLTCLVDNDWNLKQTAAEQFMHYNTMRNKYQKILALLGVDSVAGEDRLNIAAALKLRTLENALK